MSDLNIGNIHQNLVTPLHKSRHILFKAIPLVLVVVAIKTGVHFLGWEFLTLNAIFSGIIGATVFLMGFLLSGVLSDYKESEKLPGEIAAIIATMADEIEIIAASRPEAPLKSSMIYVHDLIVCIQGWMHKRERTRAVTEKIRGLNEHFLQFEALTQANFIARLKAEQNNLRKIIIRIHTIRETDFISSGYLIATSTTVLLLAGLIFAEIRPFHESLVSIGIVAYLLIFLLLLIKDLDNPFGHFEKGSSEDVSLKPIDDEIAEIKARIERMTPKAIHH